MVFTAIRQRELIKEVSVDVEEKMTTDGLGPGNLQRKGLGKRGRTNRSTWAKWSMR